MIQFLLKSILIEVLTIKGFAYGYHIYLSYIDFVYDCMSAEK